MNLDFHKIAQASRLSVLRACRKLDKRGFPGESARAWQSCDLWKAEASAMISANAEKLAPAPARQVVRELSLLIYNRILRVELAAAERRESCHAAT